MKNNEFISFLNTTVSFIPNYEDIKYRINESEFINKSYKKINILKCLKVAIYTVLVCTVSVFTTIIIKDGVFTSSGVGDVSPTKLDETTLEKYFDHFYAYGAGSPVNLFTIDIIINSNLINNTDKEKLLDYKKEYSNKRNYQFFNLYLGEKDGSDIIILSPLGEPMISFTFKSNLNYKFEDIKKEFEQLCGKELTKEFLYGSKIDNILKKETMGIILSFKEIDKKLVPYYTIQLDGKIYIIDK